MTLVFASDWKLKRGCDACKSKPGKTMCSDCRAKAVHQWHRYVASRVEKGQCIACERKRVEGEQRCPRCKKLNATRCHDWYFRVGKARVVALRKQGICTCCRKRPADGTERLCTCCNYLRRTLANGSRQAVKKPYKYVEMKLAA